jgi:hypothetical protein
VKRDWNREEPYTARMRVADLADGDGKAKRAAPIK